MTSYIPRVPDETPTALKSDMFLRHRIAQLYVVRYPYPNIRNLRPRCDRDPWIIALGHASIGSGIPDEIYTDIE